MYFRWCYSSSTVSHSDVPFGCKDRGEWSFHIGFICTVSLKLETSCLKVRLKSYFMTTAVHYYLFGLKALQLTQNASATALTGTSKNTESEDDASPTLAFLHWLYVRNDCKSWLIRSQCFSREANRALTFRLQDDALLTWTSQSFKSRMGGVETLLLLPVWVQKTDTLCF